MKERKIGPMPYNSARLGQILYTIYTPNEMIEGLIEIWNKFMNENILNLNRPMADLR